jgi:hypothetical protein
MPVSKFVPNYAHKCEVCENVPTVDVVVRGRVVLGRAALCAVCTWGEADLIDPATWNNF